MFFVLLRALNFYKYREEYIENTEKNNLLYICNRQTHNSHKNKLWLSKDYLIYSLII